MINIYCSKYFKGVYNIICYLFIYLLIKLWRREFSSWISLFWIVILRHVAIDSVATCRSITIQNSEIQDKNPRQVP